MPVRPLAAPRWRRVFPGQEAELRQVRYWLGELLPDCPARGDVVTVTIELAANAIRHSASGLGGFFAVELSWLAHPATVRVAVADAGGLRSPQSAPGGGLAALLGTGPLPAIPAQASPATVATLTAAAPGPAARPDQVGTGFVSAGYLANGPLGAGPPEPELAVPDLARPALAEDGRGLRLVAALATRAGVVGDHRGRLVWADVRWADDDTPAEPGGLDGYTEALRDIQTVLAARYPEVNIWFGRATMQWWAMAPEPGPGWLLTAESPLDLAQLLDVYRVTQRPVRRRSRGRHGLTGRQPGPPAGRPVQPAAARQLAGGGPGAAADPAGPGAGQLGQPGAIYRWRWVIGHGCFARTRHPGQPAHLALPGGAAPSGWPPKCEETAP